jgi:N-glycosylase/DNA lyase
METGAVDLGDVGRFDLQSTVESGQSFLWRRADGGTYGDRRPYGGSAWYETTVGREVVRARQVDGRLEWEASFDAVPALRRRLRLDDDLDAIAAGLPADPLLDEAYADFRGMRLVRDPFFPCLVSFICSAQMRVARIFRMQEALRDAFGEPIAFDGGTYRAYPTPERLAAATETDLRELGLGYRAPYVRDTAKLVASGEVTRADADGLPYEDARDAMTAFVGVGDKVADCVLLFSLGYLEAVPLDTWIRKAVARYYPGCEKGSYAETSRAVRERFGGRYAGYAQTYVFHHLRTLGDAAV